MQTKFPGLPPQSKGVVAEYTDKYGDVRVIHKTRAGMKTLQKRDTVTKVLARAIGPALGQNIKKARLEAGLSLKQLAEMSGIVCTPGPKQRIHEIESGGRQHGIRLGTLYALASALGKNPGDLLPPLEEVMREAGVVCQRKVKVGLVVKEPRHLKALRAEDV